MSYTSRFAPATIPATPAQPAMLQQPTMPSFGQTAPATGAMAPTMPAIIPAIMPVTSPQQPTPAMGTVSPAPRAPKSDYRDVAYILALAGLKPSRLWIKPAESTVRIYWDPAQLAALGIDPRTQMVAVCRHAAATLCGNPEAGYVYAGQSSAKPFLPYGGVEVVVDLAGVRHLAATIRAERVNRAQRADRHGGDATASAGQRSIRRANRQAIMSAQAAQYLR